MKIVFTFGGLPHYYNYVLNRLNRIENLEVIVVIPKAKGETIGYGVHQKKEGIEFTVIELDEYKAYYGKPFFKGFKNVLNKLQPDIVVTIWPYVLGFLFYPGLLLMAEAGQIKLIQKEIPFGVPRLDDSFKFYNNESVLTENLDFRPSNNRFLNNIKISALSLTRLLYYNMCKAHVNYLEDAFDILGSYGVDKRKIFVTYNSPDTDILINAFEEAQKAAPILPENKFRIIHVGRLVKWKKVDLLINAVSHLKKKYHDLELVVVGGGPQLDELKLQSEKMGIENNIQFVGGVYDPVLLGRYFVSSSVYVLAGMGGLSINEAMCFNKPVVCSVCDGTEKKLVREDYNGKYFKDSDLDDLVQKLDYLLSNPELAKQMGENSGEIIKNEVNIHTVISGYINAFNFVTGNKHKLFYNH